MKRLSLHLLVLVSLFALVLAGCNTSSPAPTDPSDPTDPTGPTDPGGDSFTLSLEPATLSLAPGGDGRITVTIDRDDNSEEVDLALGGSIVGAANDPTKVSGSFSPDPADGGSSTLSLTVGDEVAAGSYNLTVTGQSGETSQSATLELTVTGAQTVLLVDDDRSPNNYAPANPDVAPSASDTTFQGLLDTLEVSYNVYVVPGDANGPSFEQLQEYETVIWYTASQYGGAGNVGTVSSADEIVLKGFLDQGDRKALLFANSYVDGLSGTTWTESTNSFLTDYIGAVGGVADVLNNQAFTATGVADTVTAGTSFNVAADTPITTYTDVVNPAPDTDTLLSVLADPDGEGVREVAVVSGRKGVGAAGSSSAIYVGLAFENIVDLGTNSKAALLQALLNY